MKFLACLCFCFIYSLKAQITVTQSQMPKTGDTIRVSIAAPPTNTGLFINEVNKTGQTTWDFSNLEPQNQQVQSFLTSLLTPYAFYFFNKIGQKTADSLGFGPLMFKNIYSFYTSNSTTFKTEGLGYSYSGIPLAANYLDDDEVYNLPMNYLDSVQNTFDFKFSLPVGNLFSLRQKGKRTNVVIAWGSLKTPYKTYSNTLLLKSIVDEIDTITSQFGSLPIPRKQIIYKWFSNTDRTPLMEITFNVNGNNSNLGQIIYQDIIRKTPSLIQANFTVNQTSGNKNSTIFTFTNTTQPNNVQTTWKFTPNNVQYVNGTNANSLIADVVFTKEDKYTVQLTSTIFTFRDDTIATNLITVGSNSTKNTQLNNVLYPNPNIGECILPANFTVLSVSNLIGQAIPYSIQNNKLKIEAKGFVLVQLKTLNQVGIQKLLVN